MNEESIDKIIKKVVSEVTNKKMITLKTAASLIEKVESEAVRMDIAVVIAVSDASARPVAVHCMDGAYIGSFDIALNKTFTSAGFKMSTETLGRLSQPGESLYGIQHTNQGKVVVFGGGEPLIINDMLVGALGVSGGTLEQDAYLAAYGKKEFERR